MEFGVSLQVNMRCSGNNILICVQEVDIIVKRFNKTLHCSNLNGEKMGMIG